MKQFVAFRLSEELYGIPITQVQEIIQKPSITRLPQMPDFVKGVVNLRGKIVPVIDLRNRFNMPVSAEESQTRIIVSQIGTQSVGLVVDSVKGVSNLNEDTIDPLPETVRATEKQYLEGVGKMADGIIILLNLEKILTDTEKISLNAAEIKPQGA